MEITPSNLVFHELIGLQVQIAESTNTALKTISGKVVDETRNMLIIQTKERTEKKVQKNGTTFVFQIPGHLSGKHAERYVKVNGNLLLSQPENRTKNIRKIHMR
ncbi:ribonuclease P protein component 1 [Methanolobus bombayensis]|uniref:ribonuclease P protein component 1 n=1 Tax=Methanolobus bombayensis TaxID=38023 RepID=UPI001AE5F704|nr:ribonuclease P protein component 1 [Methanolobus bombayensis]MBP1909311.1 ribonuclease P protein subunit POP4 [Methanolobus bombayensis]